MEVTCNIKVHFTLFKTSQNQKTNVVCRATIWGSREECLWTPAWRLSSIWDWKGGGSSALPSGADPRTEQRAPTLEPAHPKSKSERPWFPVSCCPGWPCGVSSRARVPSSLSRSLRFSCLFFFFLLLFLFFGRGRHVPAPGWEGRRVKRKTPTQEMVQGADPRTGFSRYLSNVRLSCVPRRDCLDLCLPLCYFFFRVCRLVPSCAHYGRFLRLRLLPGLHLSGHCKRDHALPHV